MSIASRHVEFLSNCLRLDPDEARIRRIRDRIASPRFDWRGAIRLANLHQLAPALWAALRSQRLLEPVPPPLRAFLEHNSRAGSIGRPVALYLEDQYEVNRRRNAQIRAELIEIAAALNRQGIEPVVLKGGAWLTAADGLDPAIRVMRDLDLLLDGPSVVKAVSALQALGYSAVETGMPPGHHHPPMLRDGAAASVELHWHVLAPQARAVLPTEEALRRAMPFPVGGASVRILPPTERLLLNLLHAQVVDRGHRRRLLKLRDIHEFALLAGYFAATVDWESMSARLRSHGGERWLEAYLHLAKTLFGLTPPFPMRFSGAARRHYLYCRAKLALPEPLARADSVLDQFAIGFSRAMITERYGPPAGIGSLWRSRWRHLGNLRRKYRGKLLERLRGPAADRP